MPVYDFKCKNCSKVTEVLLHGAHSSPPPCPSCGAEDMQKLVSTSFAIAKRASTAGDTCCGRAERCDTPPCFTDDVCRRGKER